MIADFAISKSGDLLFQEQDINNTSLKVSFALSNTKAMKIVFDFSEFDVNTPSENALKVSFDLVKKTANKSVQIVKEDDMIAQLLTLKLKTTLGELPLRENFGSKVSLMKHQEINKANLDKLAQYVKTCIEDIITNPTVIAKPYINYSNGYKQTVILNIYGDNKSLLDYIIE